MPAPLQIWYGGELVDLARGPSESSSSTQRVLGILTADADLILLSTLTMSDGQLTSTGGNLKLAHAQTSKFSGNALTQYAKGTPFDHAEEPWETALLRKMTVNQMRPN